MRPRGPGRADRSVPGGNTRPRPIWERRPRSGSSIRPGSRIGNGLNAAADHLEVHPRRVDRQDAHGRRSHRPNLVAQCRNGAGNRPIVAVQRSHGAQGRASYSGRGVVEKWRDQHGSARGARFAHAFDSGGERARPRASQLLDVDVSRRDCRTMPGLRDLGQAPVRARPRRAARAARQRPCDPARGPRAGTGRSA